jgi:capsular polysaccharide biosynthesis protein
MSSPIAQYGALLLSRWRWVLWGILLALVATTVFLTLRPPLYRSEATVFVRTPGDVSRVQDGGDSYAQGRAGTYAALVKSTSISSRVIADLGQDLKPEILAQRIDATHLDGTALINIAVSAPSAAEAQRTASVLLSEYATTVRTLETVPGSLVPRAELVVVDPPGRPVRVVAWGAPIPVILLGATLFGLVLGSLGAVLRSNVNRPEYEYDHPAAVSEPVAAAVSEPVSYDADTEPIALGDIAASTVVDELDELVANINAMSIGPTRFTTGRHRRQGDT